MDVPDAIFAFTVSLLFSGALLMSIAGIFRRAIDEENKLTAAIICTVALIGGAIFLSWKKW